LNVGAILGQRFGMSRAYTRETKKGSILNRISRQS